MTLIKKLVSGICIFAFILSLGLVSVQAAALPIADSFEGASVSAFAFSSSCFTRDTGRARMSVNAKTGSDSVGFGSTNGTIKLNEDCAGPYENVNISVWIYDDVSVTSGTTALVSAYCDLIDNEGNPVSDSLNSGATNLDFVLGLKTDTSSTHYYGKRTYQNLYEGATSVARTTGWHKLKYTVSSTDGLTAYIDGEQIFKEPLAKKLTDFKISGISTSNTPTIVFDDFKIKSINNLDFEVKDAFYKDDGSVEISFSTEPASGAEDLITIEDGSGTPVTVTSRQLVGKTVTLIPETGITTTGFTAIFPSTMTATNGEYIETASAPITAYVFKPQDDTYFGKYKFASFEDTVAADGFTSGTLSSEQAFMGDKSIKLGTNKNEIMKYTFNEKQKTDVRISLWMYDGMESGETDKKIQEVVNLRFTDPGYQNGEFMVSINEASSTDKYTYRNINQATRDANTNGSMTASSVDGTEVSRTVGWHEIAYEISSIDGGTMYIDGTPMCKWPALREAVSLEIHYPNGGDSLDNKVFYDCFEIRPLNESAPELLSSSPAKNETNVFAGADVELKFANLPDTRSFENFVKVYKGENEFSNFNVSYTNDLAVIEFGETLEKGQEYTVKILKGFIDKFGFYSVKDYEIPFTVGQEDISFDNCKLYYGGQEVEYPSRSGSYTVKMDGRNISSPSWGFAAVAVLYSGNKVIDTYYYQEKDIAVTKFPFEMNLNATVNEDLSIRIFVWDSFKDLKKINNTIKLKKEIGEN